MRENRESIMKINMEITDDSTQSAMRAIKKNSYPEDRALYNHLKTKNLLDINLTEKQALMRAVASGLESPGGSGRHDQSENNRTNR